MSDLIFVNINVCGSQQKHTSYYVLDLVQWHDISDIPFNNRNTIKCLTSYAA